MGIGVGVATAPAKSVAPGIAVTGGAAEIGTAVPES